MERIIEIFGTGFSHNSRVFVNGQERQTNHWATNHQRLFLTPSDVAGPADLRTLVSPSRGRRAVSTHGAHRKGRRSIRSRSACGRAGSVSRPRSLSTGGGPASSGTLTNTGGAGRPDGAGTTNPPHGIRASEGGANLDVQVTGADSADRLEAKFYWPNTLTNKQESELRLKYLNVARDPDRWELVKSSGGVNPAKNKDNNLDGTTSGGRFTVTFSNTSTPKITELSGNRAGDGARHGRADYRRRASRRAVDRRLVRRDVTVTLAVDEANAGDDGKCGRSATVPSKPYTAPIHRYRRRRQHGAIPIDERRRQREADEALAVRDRQDSTDGNGRRAAATSPPAFTVRW